MEASKLGLQIDMGNLPQMLSELSAASEMQASDLVDVHASIGTSR
jgi:hypothetical protein